MMDEHSDRPSHQQHHSEESSPHKMNMGNRGATRSMSHSNSNGQMAMDLNHRMEMLHMHHQQTLWVYWMIVILGVWTILSPLTFAYDVAIVLPAGGRT